MESPLTVLPGGDGKGSKFWFTVEMGKSDRKPEPVKKGELNGIKVLVVDDNPVSREGLGTMLSSWKTEYDLVDSASACLEALRDACRSGTPYAIAILDLKLPDSDGAELGRVIKNDKTISSTHCVLLTSGGERGDAKRMKEIGFSAYLTKSVLKSDMYDSLVQIMRMSEGTAPGKDELITRHSVSENRGPKARLLLVEDNLVNQKVVQSMLLKLGHSIDVVANGKEALKVLELIPYDLIFMDCQMPEMDGFENNTAYQKFE